MLSDIRQDCLVYISRFSPTVQSLRGNSTAGMLSGRGLRKQSQEKKKKLKNLMEALGANTENQAEWQV